MAGIYTQNMPLVGPTTTPAYPQLTSTAQIGADTGLPNGENPESVAATAFDIAATALGLMKNAATATAGAATLAARSGTITSEALTTAAGATYTLTLTNTLVVPTSKVLAAVHSGTNTQGAPTIQSITPGAGSLVIVVVNNGTQVLNGTLLIGFNITNPGE